jgi:hypothetical protein
MEYTKGPWTANGNGVHKGINAVAITLNPDNKINDAQLISAAPDMYEALISIIEHVNTCSDPVPEVLWEKAEQALAKAEGKEE